MNATKTTTLQRDARKVPVAQIGEFLSRGFTQADVQRQVGLTNLVTIKRAKLIQARRERGRLEAKYGARHPRVVQLDQQMASEHRQLVQARMERDRTSATIPERKTTQWTLYGHVRDVDGHALANCRVGLYQDDPAKGRSVATATTNDSGYYEIQFPVQTQEADQAPKPIGLLKNAASGPTLYLAVQDPRGKLLQREARTTTPISGGVTYRDIVIKAVTRSGDENYPTRYLGNAGERELHDLQNEKPRCQLSAIRPDHRIFFQSTQQAEQAGYDFCAYCFGKAKSKR